MSTLRLWAIRIVLIVCIWIAFGRSNRAQESPAGGSEIRLPQAEELAGAWETEDPIFRNGTQFGIFLRIFVLRQFQPRQTTVVSEVVQQVLDVRIYRRTGGSVQGGWFSTSPNGGASWDGQRLKLNFPSGTPTFTGDALALDLTFDIDGPSWVGAYTRNSETTQIRFVRPGARLTPTSNPLVGTWESSQNAGTHSINCVRIEQRADGSLVGWRNDRSRFFIRPQGPRMQEDDGLPLDVQFENNSVTLEDETGEFPGIFKFAGNLSAGGRQIGGLREVPQLPGSSPPSQLVFTKANGQFCFPTTR